MKREDIEIRIDQAANATYLQYSPGKVFRTSEEGEFIVDDSRRGRVLGVGILGLCGYVARNGGVFKVPGRSVTTRPASKSALR